MTFNNANANDNGADAGAGDAADGTGEGQNLANGAPDAGDQGADASGRDAAGDGGENGDGESSGFAEFEYPEGVVVDETALESALPVFKDLGLNQEQAQKLMDLRSAQIQAEQKAQSEAFSKLTGDWLAEAKGDKEYGGDKFDETLSVSLKAVETFGTPALKQLMDEHGVGNHPELIRFMWKVGQTLKEDVHGGNSGGATGGAKDHAEQLYGSS